MPHPVAVRLSGDTTPWSHNHAHTHTHTTSAFTSRDTQAEGLSTIDYSRTDAFGAGFAAMEMVSAARPTEAAGEVSDASRDAMLTGAGVGEAATVVRALLEPQLSKRTDLGNALAVVAEAAAAVLDDECVGVAAGDSDADDDDI